MDAEMPNNELLLRKLRAQRADYRLELDRVQTKLEQVERQLKEAEQK